MTNLGHLRHNRGKKAGFLHVIGKFLLLLLLRTNVQKGFFII